MDIGMIKPVDLVLVGAGNRGRGIFGKFALDYPHLARFVAVVEPVREKREEFAKAHGLSEAFCFDTVESFFSAHPAPLGEGMIVASLEDFRMHPVRLGLAAGYGILCEKPLALTAEGSVRIADLALRSTQVFMVCHQMRHTPAFSTLKRLIESGEFGRLLHIEHSENVSFEHMAHSFVRGFFNNDRLTPLIVAKSCHDTDLLVHLAGQVPRRVASYGSLSYFRPENAPLGATKYCLDGCPAARECPYDVLKLYFRADTDPAYLRQMGTFSSRRELFEHLRSSRFGRCVFACDNNVVDHQVCAIEFAGGITASFSLTGHNGVERRRTRVQLTNGEIELDSSTGVLHTWKFSPGVHEVVHPRAGEGTHDGGDVAIMQNFVAALSAPKGSFYESAVARSLDGHLLAFAAEESRRRGAPVDLDVYLEELRKQILEAPPQHSGEC